MWSALSPELCTEVLQKLPPRDLLAAISTCTAWYRAYHDNQNVVWNTLARRPSVAPYAEVMTGQAGKQLYDSAMRMRRAWKAGSTDQRVITFSSFVRCIKVDWEAGSLAVGLYDGQVVLSDLDGRAGGWKRTVQGSHSSQVLAIDFTGPWLLSGSGEPSYHELPPCRQATLRIVSLETEPYVAKFEIGVNEEGHSDSINDVKIVECNHDGEQSQCHAITASSDCALIVWDIVTGKPTCRLLGHLESVTAIALVDHKPCTTVLSCSLDGQVLEWRWRTGTCLRAVITKSSVLSALSFHAPTNTLVVGSQLGQICLFRYNTKRGPREIGSYPLSNWEGDSPAQLDPFNERIANPFNEIASVQHDGDKVVFVARTGRLQVKWLCSIPDEGQPFGVYATGRSVRALLPTKSLDVGEALAITPWSALPKCSFEDGIWTRVKLYVSSIAFHGGTIVSDGFDNQVIVFGFTY